MSNGFFLFLLLLQSWTLTAKAVSPEDILPESQACVQAIEKSLSLPKDCQSTGSISSTAQPVIPFAQFQVLEVSTNQLSLEVKKKFFTLARHSYLEAVAMTEWMAEGKVTAAGNRLSQSLIKLKETCGTDLGDDVDKVINLPEDRRLDFKLSPTEAEATRTQLRKKYLLAFLESSRLSLLLKDNYLSGQQRLQALSRLKKIAAFYPMAAESQTLAIATAIQYEFNISSTEKTFDIEGPWLDDYLFPDPQTLKYKLSAPPDFSIPEKNCLKAPCTSTSTGRVASKLNLLTHLPPRLNTALVEQMQISLSQSVQSMNALCQADPCTAFSVHRTITANSLAAISDSNRREQLHKKICECNIGKISELISGRETLATLGAGVALGLTCFGGVTAIACPAMTGVFATLSTVQTSANAHTFFRGSQLQRISDFLPGLTASEKKEHRDLVKTALESQATDVAINLGAVGAGAAVGKGYHKLKDFYNSIPDIGFAPKIPRLQGKSGQGHDTAVQKIDSAASTPATDGPSDTAQSGRRALDQRIFKPRASLKPIQQIPAKDLRLFHPPGWPEKLPADIRILEGTLSDGSKAFYYESVVKSADGEISRIWREIYFDKLTGTLDCNYPSGRELFEKLVVADAGKTNVAFIDIADVGKMNQLPGGRVAADAIIKDIIEKLQIAGKGKITVGRFGGDEFVAKIDSMSSKEVKEILEEFRNLVRAKEGKSIEVLASQRNALKEIAVKNPSRENLERLAEFEKIAVPDVSIGSAQFGPRDSFTNILTLAENQARGGKIRTKVERGQSTEKYGDARPPSPIPNPDFKSLIKRPASSLSWNDLQPFAPPSRVNWDKLPTQPLKLVQGSERRVSDGVLASFADPQGNERLILTKTKGGAGISESNPVQIEIPTRGKSGLIDAQHPEAQKLIASHFVGSDERVILGTKLEDLHKINYWDLGSEAGNAFLDAIGRAISNVKITRSGDLVSKMSGKDSFLSLNSISARDLEKLQERIRKDVAENPEVKRIIAQEIESLERKLDAATKKMLKPR